VPKEALSILKENVLVSVIVIAKFPILIFQDVNYVTKVTILTKPKRNAHLEITTASIGIQMEPVLNVQLDITLTPI
jgi:hypothetical protein